MIARHELLEMTIGVREDEIDSYNKAFYLPIGMTTAVVLSSLLGVASFLLYDYKVYSAPPLVYLGLPPR